MKFTELRLTFRSVASGRIEVIEKISNKCWRRYEYKGTHI